MTGRTRRTLKAAFLLPLVLLAATPTDLTRFFCRMDGTVSAHRCCPVAKESPPAHATLQALTCCSIEQVARAEAPARPPRDGGDSVSLPAPLVVRILAVLPPVPEGRVMPTRGLRPPGLGPPLRVSKQSFLI
jgi:hypothetical protein